MAHAVFALGYALVDSPSAWFRIADDLVPVCAAIAGARIGAHLADRRNPSARTRSRRARVLGAVVLTFWLATWVLGIPAAMTDYLEREGARRGPLSTTSVLRVAFAPLPGVVMLHVETHADQPNRSDWSGWALFLWFPGVVKDLGHVPHWIA